MAETSGSAAVGGQGKVLRRSNSSRLRMHAPSSIQVAPPSGCASEWKVAIPLLSPLDICSLPGPGETAVAAAAAAVPSEKHQQISGGDDGKVGADFRRSAWRHPAEPFYYEPVPSNAPAFAVSHGAS
ncbi:hypothetical protein Taro_046303 [Colocasia esculenta]|uniref:Uncharacterized protein n=1 Tax=Colocasia esculenta TaxID=4460 RepID=A0A843WRZ6_COLES|nr:hypothetical protein [Colocasia esculenta]